MRPRVRLGVHQLSCTFIPLLLLLERVKTDIMTNLPGTELRSRRQGTGGQAQDYQRRGHFILHEYARV
jgi:hypothetical protein